MKMIMQGNDWGDAQDIEIVFRGLLTPPPRHNKKPHQTPQNTIVHTKCNYSFPCFVVYPPLQEGQLGKPLGEGLWNFCLLDHKPPCSQLVLHSIPVGRKQRPRISVKKQVASTIRWVHFTCSVQVITPRVPRTRWLEG